MHQYNNIIIYSYKILLYYVVNIVLYVYASILYNIFTTNKLTTKTIMARHQYNLNFLFVGNDGREEIAWCSTTITVIVC